MLRAIIVDDEELSIKRLNRILLEIRDVEVCASFLSSLTAYEYVQTNKVDIAFLDISMPEINGMALSGLLLEVDPSIDIVFVTAYDDYAVQAFDISALDYLMKPVNARRLLKTLDKVRKTHPVGITSTNPLCDQNKGVLNPPTARTKDEQQSLREILTEQEERVLRLIATGLSNKEIAERLDIARETVKWHIKNVYRKFGVNNRVQALQLAEQLKNLE